MPKTHSSQPFTKWVALAALLAVLTGCGGGGGGGGHTPTPTPTPAPDTTPDDITLTLPQATYAPGAVATTEQVSITDIDTPVDIAISNGGEYSINGGSFTGDAGQIANDQTLVARATAGSSFGDEVEVTLTIGTVTESFTVVTEPQDTQPEAFTPAAPETGVSRTTDYTFPEFTVAGITGEVAISIVGGVYAINDGDFGSDATTVTAGDTVAVRVTAANDFSTTTSATLTIGASEGVFSVESEAEDFNPDAFDLGEDATVSIPGETAESQIITITGINSPASIRLGDEIGEYRIVDVQEYGNSPSTVAPGQQVQVRVTAASQINTPQTATLLIGDQSDTFSVTATDQTPPTAEVVFPTANTMSDGDFVTLRGKATDDFGPVTQIEVTVTTDEGTVEVDNETITAAMGEDFQDTWSVQVDLASEKLNTIEVVATDAGGNTQQTPVILTVLQKVDALTTNFPVDNVVHIGNFEAYGIEWDRARNRLLIPRMSPEQILAVDISSGTRSVFLEDDPAFGNFSMLKILSEEDILLAGDQVFSAVYEIDLNTATFEPLTNTSTDGSDVDIVGPYAMELGLNGDLYVADGGARFYSVDMESGARTLISNAFRPDADNPFTNPTGLILDETNNRALISDATAQQLMWVDLSTGERTVWVDIEELELPFDIKLDEDDNRVILSDTQLQAILTVDWGTGTVNELSSSNRPIEGFNDLQNPWGIVIDEESNIAFVGSESEIDSDYTAILLIDLNTGERIIITNSVPL